MGSFAPFRGWNWFGAAAGGGGGGVRSGGGGIGSESAPVEVYITIVLPRIARDLGWVPTTKPAVMLELTAIPTIGLNPAEVRTAVASLTDMP